MKRPPYTAVTTSGQSCGDYDTLRHISKDLPLLRQIHKTSVFIRDNDRNVIVQPLPTGK